MSVGVLLGAGAHDLLRANICAACQYFYRRQYRTQPV